jgi:hypothetical protein
MENLKLGADYSHRELEYTGGGKQKVRELGFTYKYTWKNKNRDTKNERRGFSKISSAWSVEGELRTRITSPNTGWSKLSNNEAYLKLSTEF